MDVLTHKRAGKKTGLPSGGDAIAMTHWYLPILSRDPDLSRTPPLKPRENGDRFVFLKHQ